MGQVLGQEGGLINADSEDVVLVHSSRDLATPDCAPAKLVEVAALGHQDIAIPQQVAGDLVWLQQNCLYLRKIESSSLHIRDA